MEGTIGEIRMFAGNFAPRGWQYCQGQLESLSNYQVVYAILGTTYGGDGQVTFGLPDFQGRVAVGTGNGAGLPAYDLGEKGGVGSTTLLLPQLPSHNHTATFVGTGSSGGGGGAITATLNVVNAAGTLATGSGNLLAGNHNGPASGIFAASGTTTVAMDSGAITISGSGGGGITGGSVTVAPTGGNQPVSIEQPYLGINFIICLEGIFPSRN